MKAMILAAGFGRRLKPFTDKTPKALLTLKNKPALFWILNSIAKLDPRLVVINTHHLSSQIKEYMQGQVWPVEYRLVFEPKILDTGGALINASKFLAPCPTLVHNVDILTDYDLSLLKSQSFSGGILGYLLCRSTFESSGFLVDGQNTIVGYFTKAGEDLLAKSYIGELKKYGFCGVQYLGPLFWDFIKNSSLCTISLISIYKQAISAGFKIKALFIGDDNFLDFGSPQNFKYANSADFRWNNVRS